MTQLYYIDKKELLYLQEDMPKFDVTAIGDEKPVYQESGKSALQDALILNVLYMIQQAGSGHPGGSLSSLGIMVDLFWNTMKEGDVFISSKGHDAPALYAVMQAKGLIPFDTIHTFRRPGGLPGHPTIDVPGIIFNTGSLGMGISKANGLAAAWRMAGTEKMLYHPGTDELEPRQIYVLVGDGELQEGQNWEALNDLDTEHVRVIVDHNHHQLSKETVLPPLPIGCSIVFTTKGTGISFMRDDNDYHAGALTDEDYSRAVREIMERLKQLPGYQPQISMIDTKPYRKKEKDPIIEAYASSLAWEIGSNPKVVVMDADLAPDCGLLRFKKKFPERFIECGIAEQNMVSMATGLAQGGFIPIVHSFAAFLCRRANEQIYNACLERRHIVFVGIMAGILPEGPGTSHECRQDIILMNTMPNIIVLKILEANAVRSSIDWAVNDATGPVYISMPALPLEAIIR